MERKFSDWNVFGGARSTDDLTLFQAVENWLDRERDQLPLWLPVGTGFGIAIWQFGGPSIWFGVVAASASLALFSFLVPPGSLSRQIIQMLALTSLIGFSLITVRSEAVAQPVLGKIWIGEFYGRVESIEDISARNVFRLRLATGSGSGLPPFVRVNVTPEQFRDSFQPGAILRLRAPVAACGARFTRRL